MSLRTVTFLAVKDLRRDKKIALLVIFLLSFSYINITFFSAFINGIGNTFQNEIINTATSHIILTPSETTSPKYISDVSALRKKIELIPHVIAIAERTNVPMTITYNNKSMPVAATGVTPSDEAMVSTLQSYVIDGSFLSDQSNDEIVLGRFIAGEKLEDTIGKQTFGALIQGLGVKVGQTVTVTYSNGVKKDYRVRGIVGSDTIATVSQDAYITATEANRVLNISDQASSILVKLDDKDRANSVRQLILEAGVKNVEVRTWSEASSFVGAIQAAFGIVSTVTTIVGIVVVVVTIGIVIFINTARKKRIIGVLKAIGMSSSQIMYIFLLESLIFGILGSILGIGIFSTLLFYTNSNPIKLPIGVLYPSLGSEAMIMAGLLIVISSVIAGYLPARMASRQKILDTIKTVE